MTFAADHGDKRSHDGQRKLCTEGCCLEMRILLQIGINPRGDNS